MSMGWVSQVIHLCWFWVGLRSFGLSWFRIISCSGHLGCYGRVWVSDSFESRWLFEFRLTYFHIQVTSGWNQIGRVAHNCTSTINNIQNHLSGTAKNQPARAWTTTSSPHGIELAPLPLNSKPQLHVYSKSATSQKYNHFGARQQTDKPSHLNCQPTPFPLNFKL